MPNETVREMIERLEPGYLQREPEFKAFLDVQDAERIRRQALTPQELKAEDDAKEAAELAEHLRIKPLFLRALIWESLGLGNFPESVKELQAFGLGAMFPEIDDDGTLCTLYLLMQEALTEAKKSWVAEQGRPVKQRR